ncbi:PREDICTED: sterol O-acyltransferase 1 [Ceratosolen solmsi marchali]|uniref:O-acyltransferase n=1 Tax=Ceratosolen solmsi marchali TaxID=326594 RepID=A0AAJ7DXQ2_9HYME|nr:PREDICTED: sterol O-acyltransferase 1 [Ceratosolen solmsi marchali]
MSKNVTNVYRRLYEKSEDSKNSIEICEKKVEIAQSSKAFSQQNPSIILDGTKIETLQERMQEIRQSTMDDLNNRLNDMMSEVMQRLRVNTTQNGYHKEPLDHSKRRQNGKLTDKQFLPRKSFLTDLFEINHIRTIYNIFIVMLLILFLNTAVHDFIETGTTHLGIRTVTLGFGKFSSTIQIWIAMLLSTFATYLAFSVWVHKHYQCFPNSFFMLVLDYGFLLAYIFHQIAFIALPTKFLVQEKLPPASSLIILTEQVRMLMKTHAFVRSTAPRILAQKLKNDDKTESNCPGFSKFLYFMFAPTLVYRDEYPRTLAIRWKIVLWNFAEVVMVVFYAAFIFERFLIPPFEKFNPRIFEPQAVILTIFSITLPGLIMFLFGFYCILHSWQNGMAELLKFADKLFYRDWWNCTSYDAFYRTWNIIVHDWLYTYIYKDVYEKFHSKFLATLTVFLVSAAFHEYILAFAFRFFYPVMMLMFGGFGLLLVFITKKHSKIDGNIFIWFSLFMGNGIIFTLYLMEYHARSNCPPYDDQLFDLLMPRSWICHNILSNVSVDVKS